MDGQNLSFTRGRSALINNPNGEMLAGVFAMETTGTTFIAPSCHSSDFGSGCMSAIDLGGLLLRIRCWPRY